MAMQADGHDRKIAWIVGASSGIGRALAVRLARDGWRIAASARRAALLETLRQETYGAAEPFPLDIRDAAAVRETLSAIEAGMGPVTLAIFAAGTYERERAGDFDAGAMARMVELNLLGNCNCLDAAIPAMTGRGAGQILLVSSVAGYVGLPGGGGYGATKAALITLAEALHPKLRQQGVLLRVVNPGFVETPLTAANDFPMPFIISAEEAAGRIASQLGTARFEIAFPKRLALSLKLLRLLPYPLFFAITRRMLRPD